MLFDITIGNTTYTGVKEMVFVSGNMIIKGFTYEGTFYKKSLICPDFKIFEIERSDIDETKIPLEEMARSFQSMDVQTSVQVMPVPQNM